MRSRQWALNLLKISDAESKNLHKLRQAYYSLAKSLHPDSSDEKCTRQFQQVHEAYRILSADLKASSTDESHNDFRQEDDVTTSEHSKGRLDWGGYWWMMDFYKNSIPAGNESESADDDKKQREDKE
jgi:DnaJ-class molecular chaperone